MTDQPDVPSPYDGDALPSPTDLWSVDPNAVVDDWTATHEPLTADALAEVASAFVASVGAPAREESAAGVTEDASLRVADADAFGQFTHEHDVALLEPGEEGLDPEYGYLFGYTTDADSADDRGVPLLVCLPGPLPDAVDWLERFSEALAEMPRLGIVRP